MPADKRLDRKKRRAEAARRESEAIVVRQATKAFASALDLIDNSLSMLAKGAKAAILVHTSLTRGSGLGQQVSTRLEVVKASRMISFIGLDLAKKVKAARDIDLELPKSSEAGYVGFIDKISQAIDLLEQAEKEAPSLLSAVKKPPLEIRELSRGVSTASVVLKKTSARLKSRVSIVTEAALDSLMSRGLEFE